MLKVHFQGTYKVFYQVFSLAQSFNNSWAPNEVYYGNGIFFATKKLPYTTKL